MREDPLHLADIVARGADPDVLRAAYSVLLENHRGRPEPNMWWEFANNPNVPVDVLEDMTTFALRHPLTEKVIKNKSVKSDTIHRMAQHLIDDHRLTPLLRTEWGSAATDGRPVLDAIANSPKAKPETLQMIANAPAGRDRSIAAGLSGNKRTPVDILNDMTDGRRACEPSRLASNRAIAAEKVLDAIDSEQSPETRKAYERGLARRTDLSLEVTERILVGEYSGALTSKAIKRTDLSADAVNAGLFNANAAPKALNALAVHPLMTKETIARATTHPDPRVREAALLSPLLSLSDYVRLRNDYGGILHYMAVGREREIVSTALGISPLNTEAIDMVLAQDYSSFTPDSPEVQMALLMHNNPTERG